MKQNLRLITFIFLICLLYGCATDKHKYQAYQDLKEFVVYKDSPWLRYYLFFQTKNKNEIAWEEASYVRSVFHDTPKFKGIDIDSYFKDLMMGKIILSCEDGNLGSCFTLAPNIMDDYKKNCFKEFLKKYATYSEENNRYIINPALSKDEKLSIAYYFFLNNIYTGYDCYFGYYISRKVPLYILEEFDELEEIEGEELEDIEE